MGPESGTDASDSGSRRYPLSTVHLFLFLPWIGLVIAARHPIKDNSFLWHVEAGHLQIASGEVLRVDPFSFTMGGEAWRTQSWMADIGYASLQSLGDLTWVASFIGITAGATLVLVGWVAYHHSRSLVGTALAMVALVWVGVSYFSPRPVLVSYLMLVVTMAALAQPSKRWALPLILWVWAAVHGSFVLGLGLILLDGLRRRDRDRIADAALSVVTSSLTAHGLALWGILFTFSQNQDALDLISEWAPPDLLGPGLLPYGLSVALLLIGGTRGLIARRDLWVIVPFLLFGFSASRAVFPSMLVLTPWIAAAIGDLVGERIQSQPVAGIRAVMHGVVALAILGLPFLLAGAEEELDPKRFPIDAATVLEDRPTFHDDVIGGFLIYRRFPAVFLDDRAELFGEALLTDMIDTRAGREGWQDVFDTHSIEQVILRRSEGLVEVLRANDWVVRHEDELFVVLTEK